MKMVFLGLQSRNLKVESITICDEQKVIYWQIIGQVQTEIVDGVLASMLNQVETWSDRPNLILILMQRCALRAAENRLVAPTVKLSSKYIFSSICPHLNMPSPQYAILHCKFKTMISPKKKKKAEGAKLQAKSQHLAGTEATCGLGCTCLEWRH